MRNTSSGRDGRQSFCALASTLIILLALSQATASSVAPPMWPTLGGNMQRSGLSPNVGPTLGCVKWTFDTATPPTTYTQTYANAGLSSSAVVGADGTIYFTSDNGTLYALDPAGQLLWKYAFQPQAKQTWAWPLNDTTGLVAHASAGGLDAELVNFTDPDGAHWVPDDRFGRALQFDGIDDYLRVPGLAGVGGSAARRVSAWIKTTATSYNPILHWGNDAATTNAWRLITNAEGKPAVLTEGSATANVAINTGQWVHIEALLPPGAFQAADIQFFIDGQPVAATFAAGSSNWINTGAAGIVYIGYYPIGGKSFSGLMADVRIEELESSARTVSGPTIGPNGVIYAAYGQTLFAINPDGSQLWKYDTGAFIHGAPAVATDGTVFFGSADGKIYALDANGQLLWSNLLSSSITPAWQWPLNDGLGTVAAPSTGPYKAQLQNFDGTADSGWVPDDKFGSTLNFDGINDYITIPGFKGIGGSGARRVSAWIKTTTGGPILYWGDPQNNTGKWSLLSNGVSVDSGSASFSIVVNDGQWHHIEATLPPGSFYPSQILFKIDGVVVASGGTGTLPINSAMVSDCIIGARPSGVWSYFKGMIADVRIEEVKPVASVGPWQWPLNDGTGTEAVASSGPYDGQLQNFDGTADSGWISDDKFGSALKFDGVNDVVTIPGFKGIGGGTPRRVSAWIKANNTTKSATIVFWGNNQSLEGFWSLSLSTDGKPRVNMNGDSATTAVTVTDGKWHLIEATVPYGAVYSNQIGIAIDGVPAIVTGGSSIPINSATISDVSIGSRPNTGSFFTGMIADVRIEEIASAIDNSAVIVGPSLGLDGSVYAGGVYQPTLCALDPADGHLRWQSPLDCSQSAKSFVASPVVAPDGTIYAVLAGDTNLYAFDPANGAILRMTNLAHTPELAGYWKFDETGSRGASNSAPDGLAATLPAGDVNLMWFPGQINGAFSSYYPSVANFLWPAKTAARTICAWVRNRSLDAGRPQGNIIGWTTTPKSETWVLRVNNTDGRVYLGINNGYIVGNRQLNDLEWHHIAVVLSPLDSPNPTKYTNLNMAQIYIDGILDADKDSNHGLVLSTNTIGSGSADQTATMVLRGTNAEKTSNLVLDELRLYNTALTADQIREITWTQTDFTNRDPAPATTAYKDRSGWVEPAVGSDGTVYVAFDDQYLRAVRTDGTIAWTKYLGEKGSYSLTVTPDNRIFAAGEEGHLYVLDAAGQSLADLNTQALVQRWDATKLIGWGSSLVGYPVIAPDGRIYLSDAYNRLWAIDNDSCQTPGATLAWPKFRKANISPDLRIDLADFAVFAAEWLKCTNADPVCQAAPWVYVAKTYPWRDFLTADINQDRFVDLDDLALIMELWLAGN
jgi:outer membrane protein assembly factor BamB